MAATITLAEHDGKQPSKASIRFYLDFQGDNSYPAGGYDFDPGAVLQSLGLYDKKPEVQFVIVEPKGNFIGEFDRGNLKLIFRQISDGAEVAGATDLSGANGLLRVKVESE